MSRSDDSRHPGLSGPAFHKKPGVFVEHCLSRERRGICPDKTPSMTFSRIAFVFAGQGAQFSGMGKELFDSSPAARDLFLQADDILGRSISHLCFEAPLEELTSCANCQPSIFTMSLACHAALQETRPTTPAACAGLSLGELSALVAAGVCAFPDALRLVQLRGRLMDAGCQATPGAMTALLGATPEQALALAEAADVDIANLNCPGQIILSGPADRMAALPASPLAAGLRLMPLNVAGAYHSRLMAQAAEQFAEAVEKLDVHRPACAFAQNVTGQFAEAPTDIRRNLVAQISHTVRCEDCLRRVAGVSDFIIEFGPGTVLCGLMKRIERSFPTAAISSLDTLKRTLETING